MIKTNKSVIILGNPRVGKSCILNKLTKNQIQDKYKETYGCNFIRHEIEYFDQKVIMNIWDTCGEEDLYHMLKPDFYQDAKGFFIVCSYDDRDSFESLAKWTDFIRENIENENNIPIFVLINKSDVSSKHRKFSIQEIKDSCKSLDLPYIYETSIFKNVSYCFEKMTEYMLGRSFSYRKSSVLSETTRMTLSKANHPYINQHGIYVISETEDNTDFNRDSSGTIIFNQEQFENLRNNLNTNHIVDIGDVQHITPPGNDNNQQRSNSPSSNNNRSIKSKKSNNKSVKRNKKNNCCGF